MRIAHVANFYGPRSGGLRTAMHALGAGYRQRGHEVLLVVPGTRDVREDTPWGTRVTLRSPLIPRSGGYRAIVRLDAVRTALARFAPDVLEVSDRTTLTPLADWARAGHIPTVFFAHERADGVLRANLGPALTHAAWIRRAVDRHNSATHARFDAVVCTTDFAAGEFTRLGLPTVTVPLGVDLARFHPSRRDPALRGLLAAPDESLLVLASRLSREKAPLLAVEAVRVFMSQGRRVRLVVAGAGPLEPRMRHLAQALPVDLLGFVDNAERFAALLATADAVVAPGPIETFGLAALEALASGTPVVAHAESALPEVIGAAGVEVRGTPGDVAAGIRTLLARDPVVRRADARARAETMPWERTVETMEALHLAALAGVRVSEAA
ncbi:glycosyltransferase [Demequina sp. NBRC 110057]|uniref:glycosyltransferase n=1 Tax=Demequina sp. NBRC 110057 TaxID=1570346 RepID=UPI000A018DE4|nr:glycosyltransferase [Demequina sp. NBRC 110057]